MKLKRLAHWLRRIPREIPYVLLLFLVSRIVLTIIGVVSRILLEPYHGAEYTWIYSTKLWLDIWGVWDTGWYLSIAKDWYPATATGNWGFFPLYPLLMRLGAKAVGDPFVVSIIISSTCMIIAAIYLFKLVALDSDKKTALRAVFFLFLFPTAFILSGGFTESLFLALLVACFYSAKKNAWWLVGILGFFLSLTRITGVTMLLPLAWVFFAERKPGQWKPVFWLLLIPLGLACFIGCAYAHTGDPLAYVHAKENLIHPLENPVSGLLRTFDGKLVHVFEGIFTVIALVLLLGFARLITIPYLLIGLNVVLVSLVAGNSTWSMPRYLLVVFPLYIILAKLAKRPWVNDVLVITLGLMQGFLMVFWANGFKLVM